MNDLFELMVAFLKEAQWKGTEDRESGNIGLSYKGTNGEWTCIFRARQAQQQIMFYSQLPFRAAAPDDLAAMGMLLHLINFGLVIGNFELDVNDGEIRYKTSMDVQNVVATNDLIRPMILANLATTDKYAPAIYAVLEGASPEQALAQVQ